MGQPATPTAAERKATLDLAAKIVESVRNDEAWPVAELIGTLEDMRKLVSENVLFAMAHALTLATDERDEALRILRRKTGIVNWPGIITERVAMGVKSLRCPQCGGDGEITTTSWGETTTETCRTCNGAGEVFDEVGSND